MFVSGIVEPQMPPQTMWGGNAAGYGYGGYGGYGQSLGGVVQGCAQGVPVVPVISFGSAPDPTGEVYRYGDGDGGYWGGVDRMPAPGEGGRPADGQEKWEGIGG